MLEKQDADIFFILIASKSGYITVPDPLIVLYANQTYLKLRRVNWFKVSDRASYCLIKLL